MFPFSETPSAATESGRRKTDQGQDAESFRPLALPALAAAVRMRAPVAEKAAQRPQRRGILALLHEDAPLA
ncbi:hypothetical protein U8607_01625 [Methylobacterium durans]|uniref:Uncharacterized protein n=1 Tax=Methylobacterium durans TaxID=2202825 RepID=A0A2U8W097_9HYPH|nr:hypothetical protein [Methylobacterium durans]AWN39455.1 hypothetical protein DK389_01475 [Methylobacterium durans]MEA1830771.1 hypothetical protein [Methylobacterium durans]